MRTHLSLDRLNRILLLGGGDILLEVATTWTTRGVEVQVITSPRHAEEVLTTGLTLRAALHDRGVRCLETASITAPSVAETAGDMSGTVALSLGAAWIFRKPTIEGVFRGKLLNAHGTRLPLDKGGGGWSWQIMNGNRLGMCLLHVIDEGIDTGDIVAAEEFLYPAACRIPADYSAYYRAKVVPFLDAFVTRLAEDAQELTLCPQTPYFSTYFPRLNTALNGWIDWAWPAAELERFICAFDRPYLGASTRLEGRVVRFRSAMLQGTGGRFHPYQSGLVYRTNGRWLMVAASGGELVIESVTDEVGREILGEIREGDRFVTPVGDLVSARRRVMYNPYGLVASSSAPPGRHRGRTP
jgi:methionyl-tRNA formyltransferase